MNFNIKRAYFFPVSKSLLPAVRNASIRPPDARSNGFYYNIIKSDCHDCSFPRSIGNKKGKRESKVKRRRAHCTNAIIFTFHTTFSFSAYFMSVFIFSSHTLNNYFNLLNNILIARFFHVSGHTDNVSENRDAQSTGFRE